MISIVETENLNKIKIQVSNYCLELPVSQIYSFLKYRIVFVRFRNAGTTTDKLKKVFRINQCDF